MKVTGEAKGAAKSPGQVYIRQQHFKMLRKFFREGVTSTCERKHKHGKGKRKTIKVTKTFCLPKDIAIAFIMKVPCQRKLKATSLGRVVC